MMFRRKRDKLDNRKMATRKLYDSGLTDVEIAGEMGVTRRAVSLWRRRNSLPRRSRKGRTYATWHHRALLLYRKGWTLEGISEHVGQKRATVRDTIRRMEVSG